MTMRLDLNDGWLFSDNFEESMIREDYDESEMEPVRIPHPGRTLPFHYFSEQAYQMVAGYRMHLFAPAAWIGRSVRLNFGAVAHDSAVFVNGRYAGEHHCGYTAFSIEIGPLLRFGQDNVITVRADSRESRNIPPFGFVIDYLTYAGIYRAVTLEVKEPARIADVFVQTKLAERYVTGADTEDAVAEAAQPESLPVEAAAEAAPAETKEASETPDAPEPTETAAEKPAEAPLTAAQETDAAPETTEQAEASAAEAAEAAETPAEEDQEAFPGELRCAHSRIVSHIRLIGAEPTMTLRQSFRPWHPADEDQEEYRLLREKPVEEAHPIEDPLPDVRRTIEGMTEEKEKGNAAHFAHWETDCNDEIPESLVVRFLTDSGDIALWEPENPALYELKTELLKDGEVLDCVVTRFGFRRVEFRKDGFWLNGRKRLLRGLNRHQSFPYVGYAMPDSMQRLDADILKNEIGVNAVRTSHYPQSHAFVDRCDELGLLVFTEIPGWQYIGDAAWKRQAIRNVRDMVIQYRNHPSIMLWGVRINESPDDDAFYARTNAVCRLLDRSRPTGGVRCIPHSKLIEDVYTYNDFLHDGVRPGCAKKEDITSDVSKPYLISEYNGHMFPTKTFDSEEHRTEHALRHARVLDAVAGTEGIAGSFGWCMFDYNTHKDFGSGDRICYHGVLDMFRNPKPAAAVYASQSDQAPVLEVASSMDIGEHPASIRGPVYAFTNADSVRMYRNDHFVAEFPASGSPFGNLPHGPILIDDFIGNQLQKNEGMPAAAAKETAALLNDISMYGEANLSKSSVIRAAQLSLRHHITKEDIGRLYQKYIGDWGQNATTYRFEAVNYPSPEELAALGPIDGPKEAPGPGTDEYFDLGRVVKTVVKAPMTRRHFAITIDHRNLVETDTYDVALIRIREVDEHGNLLCFANDPLVFRTEGSIELIGPRIVPLRGGMSGTYVRSTGTGGPGTLRIADAEGHTLSIDFQVEIRK